MYENHFPVSWFKLLIAFPSFFFFTALPQIAIRPSDNPITVIAGETTDLNCIVGNARPSPAILWMIGKK